MELFKFYTAGQGKATAEVCNVLGSEIYPSVHESVEKLYSEFESNAKKVLFVNDDNTYILPIAGTGSLAMEILLCNIIEKDETIMLSNNGFFASRLSEIALRHEARIQMISKQWGEVITVEDVKKAYEESKAKVLYMIHGETSTGILQPIEEIGEYCKENGILLLLDCATTIGGTQFRMTEWHVNGMFTISQKCLATSPGISIVAVDRFYIEKMKSISNKKLPFYLDLQLLIYQSYEPRTYHHTQPYSLINSLNLSMKQILVKGIEDEWTRYKRNCQFITKQLELLGVNLFIKEDNYRLPQLITCLLPNNQDNSEFIVSMKKNYNIYLSKGIGLYQSNMIRIGLLGNNSQKTEIIYLLLCMLSYFSEYNNKIDTVEFLKNINDFGGENG